MKQEPGTWLVGAVIRRAKPAFLSKRVAYTAVELGGGLTPQLLHLGY